MRISRFSFLTYLRQCIENCFSIEYRVIIEISCRRLCYCAKDNWKIENSGTMNNREEVDLYRDTYVRYLGYANEVGEAFRSLVPKSIVWFSYALSSGYVLADTVHKGAKVYQANATSQRTKNVLLSTSDTLIWQTFASIIVPGFTINRICTAVQFAQRKSTRTAFKKPWISTLVGLVSIPFIIHPIDHAVEGAMDVTYRKWTGYHPKVPLCGIKHE